MKKIIKLILALLGILFPLIASAHEAYVIPKADFWETLRNPLDFHAFAAWQTPHNIMITLYVVIGTLILIALNYFFRRSSLGQTMHQNLEKFSSIGPVFVRLAIAASFFYSAKSLSFLGPELALTQMPYGTILQWGLYLCSALILVGFLTELAGAIALIIFTIGFFTFGAYVFTYLNYLGEIIVLLLFGLRRWSVDAKIFGPLKRLASFKKYESTIVRVCYGLALIYAGVTVKLLHPDLTIRVVNDWHLTQFHWLFPSDPLLVTLGAGLAEIAIGLFILFGFEIRLTVIITLFYITLSLFYFRELVWPHLLLYGISLNLLVQPEIFTVDQLLFPFKKKK